MEPAKRSSFSVLNRQRIHKIDNRAIHVFLRRLVGALDVPNTEFSVVFITDAAMRDYNRNYRGLDKTTDVLSFCGEDSYLGDILISSETAYNQAHRSRTLSFETNLHRLMLHGLLHLMGYDHETDEGQMRTIERRLRRKLEC
jgi:probable rRNA maturation factor